MGFALLKFLEAFYDHQANSAEPEQTLLMHWLIGTFTAYTYHTVGLQSFTQLSKQVVISFKTFYVMWLVSGEIDKPFSQSRQLLTTSDDF